MARNDARQKLLDLIDRKAFDPVLKADPKDYKEADRKKLKDAQSTTRSTKKRYHESYSSTKAVYDNYKADLSSDSAKAMQQELRDLDLPTLPDIKDEVEDLARELGIKD